MQTTAIWTVAKSLPENEVILLTLLISKRYIPYTDLRKISVTNEKKHINTVYCVHVCVLWGTHDGFALLCKNGP